jgi:hypothetical protein
VSGFYSLEGLRKSRAERERHREGPANESLLAQIPPDAPYDDPDAVLHVWTGEKWMSYEKWLATAPIMVEQVPAPIEQHKEEAREAGREQLQLPIGSGNHGYVLSKSQR